MGLTETDGGSSEFGTTLHGIRIRSLSTRGEVGNLLPEGR